MGARVLVVDDEPAILRVVQTNLARHEFRVDTAETGRQALDAHLRLHPDVLLLDLGLPDIGGLDVIREIRTHSSTPIIVLSVRGAERDKVQALTLGADDYLTKPFGVEELLARVRVALRHSARLNQGADAVFRTGDLEVDIERRRVSVAGQEVHLTPTEYALLKVLVTHPNRVVTDRLLLQEVWGGAYGDEAHYLYVYVARLRIFRFRGDRLAFTGGIVVLAIVSSILIVAYNGSVTGLIPLYTVGVFIAFTLSQAGLVKHWYELRDQDRGWRWRAAVNAIGAVTTAIVTVEVAVSKFTLGAWMVLVLIPILIGMMWAIRSHYLQLESYQRPETPLDPRDVRLRAIVPIASLNVPARQALAFARAMTNDDAVTAVHVTDDPDSAERLEEEWQGSNVRTTNLVVIESPYRSLAGPLLRYIDALHDSHPDDTLVIVLPEYVPRHWWEHLLHNQTALRLKAALLFHPGVIVANVPYHLAR